MYDVNLLEISWIADRIWQWTEFYQPLLIVRRNPTTTDPIRAATIEAVKNIIDSLLELVFDAGVTVQQLNYVLRERAVHIASRRVFRETGRTSKARVAIITGLPRSEVSRISKSPDLYVDKKLGEQPTRRLLAAWFDDPRFLTPTGEPATLPIFGKSRSFEQLVAMHGAGIPVRAMLDELIQIDAVERVTDQSVRARSRVPITVGLTTNAISAVGARCGDLLQTLTNNLRRTMPPMFEATSVISNADPRLVPMIRRQLAEQGTSFITTANSILKRSQRPSRKGMKSKSMKARVGVTAYYFEDLLNDETAPAKRNQEPRTNLKRRFVSRKKTKPKAGQAKGNT